MAVLRINETIPSYKVASQRKSLFATENMALLQLSK